MPSYYRGAAGAFIVYHATSRASFLHAEEWLTDVRAHADPNLLVANKVDLLPEEEESASALQHKGEHPLVAFTTGERSEAISL